MSTGFWRYGSDMSGDFVILLRYDMSELWETGGGAEMWAAETARKEAGVFIYRGGR